MSTLADGSSPPFLGGWLNGHLPVRKEALLISGARGPPNSSVSPFGVPSKWGQGKTDTCSPLLCQCLSWGFRQETWRPGTAREGPTWIADLEFPQAKVTGGRRPAFLLSHRSPSCFVMGNPGCAFPASSGVRGVPKDSGKRYALYFSFLYS